MKKNFWNRLWSVDLIFCVVLFLFVTSVSWEHVQAAKGIRLNKQKVTLQVGQSTTLKVKGTKKSVTWSSKNRAVAVVNAKGKVTARQKGSTEITAKTAGKTYKCKVSVKQVSEAAPTARPQGYTFRSDKLLQEHYEKHGREMGYENAAAYVAGANRVISSPDALHKLEAEDGDHVYFLEATGEIVFVSTDGYIRTYFISDIGYFNRQ